MLGFKGSQTPYGNLQSLLVPTHRWKDFLMDFVTGLPILTDWKGDSYDSILVIVDWLTKMVYYEPVKVTIDALELAKIILDMVVRHHGLPDSIVSDRGSLFISKFWSSLCYFLGIKWRLSTAFYPQTDGQTKRQNSTMEAYLRAFVNFEQNDWARLLPMPSLRTTMPRMQALVTHRSSWTAATTLGYRIRKKSTLTLSRNQWTNHQRN